MSRFLISDASHLFNRCVHVVKGTPDEIAGMCLATMLSSVGKMWRTQHADHLIFVFDGRSWRKDIYPPYKRNRAEARAEASPEEQERSRVLYDAFDAFQAFIIEHTNCTVLYNPTLEADDLIAGFVQSHPNDEHTIVGSDKDFYQLLAPNVMMYDGVEDKTITMEGFFDYKGRPIKDKKSGLPKAPPEPEWSVFEKAVRGCTTDKVFAAYPGARVKGSKNKVGMREAFNDRDKQGFNWSAFMLTRWTDHEGKEHRVLDDYHRNVVLVNLSKQPEDIRQIMMETIAQATIPKTIPQVGIHFLKFCGRYQLLKISEQSSYFAELLSIPYPNA
jgi:hypothetical protein